MRVVKLERCDGCGDTISQGVDTWNTEISRVGDSITYLVTHPNFRCASAAEARLGRAGRQPQGEIVDEH